MFLPSLARQLLFIRITGFSESHNAMNIYTPEDIDRILTATIGTGNEDPDSPEARRRLELIMAVGAEVAETVCEENRKNGRVVIFAGSGLNGAFALQTATELHANGIPAEVYLINIGGNRLTPDARAARDRFTELADSSFLFETTGLQLQLPDIDESTVIVDGLFGHEHNGPLMGGYQHLARFINESEAFVISIDLPSGMSADLSVGMINRNIIHADITLTLVGPTTSFYMKENDELIGRWRILPVDLDPAAMQSTRCSTRLIEARNIRRILPVRDRFASKADLGNVILYAGSYGMLGAAVLATRAALRSGCGRVTCHGPRCGFFVMQSSVPSAMFETDGGDTDIRNFDTNGSYDGIGIGPGIGRSDATILALEKYLKASNAASQPLVLDADALNCIALRPTMLDYIPARSVLTPHPGEFDRLFGHQPSSSARLLKAIETARAYSIIIVLKGHYTTTVWPDGSVLINSSGTEALACPGSGDVLTGLITGLIAQRINPEHAAVAGVYIHGIAGQIARRRHGIYGTTAEDIAEAIGLALESIVYPQERKKT